MHCHMNVKFVYKLMYMFALAMKETESAVCRSGYGPAPSSSFVGFSPNWKPIYIKTNYSWLYRNE
jgi:hypothetical protein